MILQRSILSPSSEDEIRLATTEPGRGCSSYALFELADTQYCRCGSLLGQHISNLQNQQFQHADIQQNALGILKLLQIYPLHHLRDEVPGDLITQGLPWSSNAGQYDNKLMWEDIIYSDIQNLPVLSRENSVKGVFTLGKFILTVFLTIFLSNVSAKIIENWQAND